MLYFSNIGAGQRQTNWKQLVALAEKGDMQTIKEDFPREYLLNNGHIRKIRNVHKKTLPTTRGLWIYGPSGCGKSSGVREYIDESCLYEKLCNKWWDDYDEQPAVLLDDVDKSMVYLGQFIKRWCDHYPFRGEYKGGSRMFAPDIVIITSQYLPCQIWDNDPELVAAIERRCELIDMSGALV